MPTAPLAAAFVYLITFLMLVSDGYTNSFKKSLGANLISHLLLLQPSRRIISLS
jgi:hypothetical protein